MAKILIVDDDPDFVNITRVILEKDNHEVIAAAGGDAGYQRALNDKPDLVILDIVMDTVLDGLSVCQRMRNTPMLRDIPIIMVTSIANADYAELFPKDEHIQINAFLSKPISADELLQQVNQLLSNN